MEDGQEFMHSPLLTSCYTPFWGRRTSMRGNNLAAKATHKTLCFILSYTKYLWRLIVQGEELMRIWKYVSNTLHKTNGQFWVEEEILTI